MLLFSQKAGKYALRGKTAQRCGEISKSMFPRRIICRRTWSAGLAISTVAAVVLFRRTIGSAIHVGGSRGLLTLVTFICFIALHVVTDELDYRIAGCIGYLETRTTQEKTYSSTGGCVFKLILLAARPYHEILLCRRSCV